MKKSIITVFDEDGLVVDAWRSSKRLVLRWTLLSEEISLITPVDDEEELWDAVWDIFCNVFVEHVLEETTTRDSRFYATSWSSENETVEDNPSTHHIVETVINGILCAKLA